MNNLNQLILKRLKSKHAKLSKRFLRGVETGNFQQQTGRKRYKTVERLKRIERQIKTLGQKSGFSLNLNFKHWAVALALGAVVSVANGQSKKSEVKNFRSRVNSNLNIGSKATNQRGENQTITLTEVAQLGNAYPENLLTGDFDGDGDNDVMFVSYLGGMFLLTNNGAFNFSTGPNITDDLIYGTIKGDFDGDGDLDVLYKIFPTQETYALLNDGSGVFTKQAATIPNTCFSSEVGDIDGDGDDDILISNNYCDLDYANGPYDSFGFKLLTNNNLNFAESAELIAGVDGQTRFIGFADIDGDGDLDIPVIHRTLATNTPTYMPGVTSFKAFLNDGSGNFSDAGFDIDPGLSTNFPRTLLGDIDGDGSVDISWSDGSNNVAILNNGAGVFTPQSPTPLNISFDKQNDRLIDLDGDDLADIVNEGFSNDSTILFSGDGVGGFTQETKISGESVLSDLDGDGDPDFITVNGNVELNELQPGFTVANRNDELVIISQTYDVDVVDIDDDGDNDIVHAGEQNTSRVWLNDGTGTNFTIGQRLDSAAIVHVFADLDGDGDPDMIRANDFDQYQFPNKPGIDINSNESGTITFQSSVSVKEVDDIGVADMDGDGDLDLCALRSDFNAPYLKVFTNEGSFAFNQIDSIGFASFEERTNQFELGDIDGDTDIDVVLSYGDQGFTVAINDGSGDLTLGSVFTPQGSTFKIEDVDLADFDGDGDLDVFASNGDEYATASYVFINDGDGNFTDNGQNLTIGYIYRSAIVDLDLDGDIDIITGGYLSNPQIWTNDGSANFTQDSAVPILADEYAQPAFGDLDGDGDIDLAYGGFYNPNLIFLNESENCVSTSITLDNASLTDLIADCEVISPEVPTATTDCDVVIDGVPNILFPITALGTTVVTWTFDDGQGNTTTQIQNIVIENTTPPTPVLADLADLTAECEVLAPTPPEANSSCGDLVFGVSDVTFPITSQGTTIVTWTFEDLQGNETTQVQNVIIENVTPPVPDLATIPDVIVECEADITPPLSTSTCGENISGVADVTFPLTDQGTTVVTWTYEDAQGNVTTQQQSIIIEDITVPVALVNDIDLNLSPQGTGAIDTDLIDNGSSDNCGEITLSLDKEVFNLGDLGVNEVTLTADDGNGNSSSALATITVIAHPIYFDSLALVDFYNSTNGGTWTNNANWLTGNLSTWEGITITNDRVTGITLPENNLSGAITESFNDLESLTSVDLSDNLIEDIQTDFANLTLIESFNLAGNALDFGDLENISGLNGLNIGDQSIPDEALDERLPVGSSISFTFQVGGANTAYQWFKDDEILPNEISNTISIESINRSNMGEYVCEATNSIFPDLAFTSSIKRVIAIAEISGVLSVSDNETASAGAMQLLKITSTGGYDTTSVTSVNNVGEYVIDNIALADYLLVGIADTLQYPGALPTYFNQTPFWAEADTLALNANVTINLVSAFSTNPVGGIGRFSGILEEELPEGGRTEIRGRVRRAGVSVRRGRSTGRGEGAGELAYYVYTNENGEFLIPEMEPGEYNLDIQYPGYPMNEDSFINITIGNDKKTSEIVVAALVDNDVITVTQLVILGFNEKENGLKLYPNPTSDWLRITDFERRTQLSLSVYNMNGSEVKTILFSAEGEVQVSDLSAGQYIVKVKKANGETLITRSILIEKK